jgi:two-component system LytT family response regulator
MIDAIIIDDEKNAVITLDNDIKMYCPEVNVAMRFTKPAEALAYLGTHATDIIFLDINMPVMNGFDFIAALEKPVSAHIIFISAYNEFAVKAFKVSALDYLLKPIDPAELQAAVQKAVSKNTKPADQEILFKNFMANYAPEGPKGKIALPVNDGYHLIDPSHIIYCRAKGAYTEIITDNEKNFLISRSLGRIQELVPEEMFERIHQSYLVNLSFIKKFRKGESATVSMSNSDVLKVSRMNKDRLSMRLGIK